MVLKATGETLGRDLRNLGVEPGDILFIHSSFKSIGPVVRGAETVIGALEQAVGPDGLLLLPSFHLLPRGQDARAALEMIMAVHESQRLQTRVSFPLQNRDNPYEVWRRERG